MNSKVSVSLPFSLSKIHRAVGVALLAAASTAVVAEDSNNLDTLVVTAAGFEQKLTDAPASISVITREELSKRPYTSLLDAVQNLEGVDIGETRDKTGQGSISMRGMGSDYTLVLINGRRQNNHGDIYPNNFGGNQFNHIPPLDAIERIEVIRGPASTLYGADALGGVINIITRKDAEEWNGSITFSRTLQTDDSFGDDVTTDFNAMGPLIPGVLNLGLRGSIYDQMASTPEYAPATDPDGVKHERDLGFGSGGKTVDNTNLAGGFSLIYTPDQRQSFNLDYDTSIQKYDNEGSQVGTVDSVDRLWFERGGSKSPRTGYAEEQEFTREEWAFSHEGHWDFGSSLISLAHLATNNNGRTLPLTAEERADIQQMYDATGPYAGMTEDELRDLSEEKFLPRPKRTMESRQYTLDAKLDIPLGDHQVITGAQVIRGELEDGVFGMYGDSYKKGETQEHNMWSLFAEDNWMLHPSFILTAGVRYDDHETFGGQTSPRLYGVYDMTESWTLKGGVSTGYKTPKTTDLFQGITGFGGQGTIPFVGTPDLEPETSISSELAIYWQHPVERHNFNATVFRNDFQDKIQSQGDLQSCEATGGAQPCADIGEGWQDLGYDTFTKKVNIDEALIQGLEVAGRYQLLPALALRANYTYTDSEQLSGEQEGYPLTGTAEHMANATLDWDVNQDFNLFLTVEARSDRFRGFGRGNTVNEGKGGDIYYEDYQVLHLGASWRINDSVTLNGRVNNLLNEDFTSYTTVFEDDGSGGYEATYYDDYNNKDKARNFWVSLNVAF
ncbi:TonB-dependent receptor domain-containing protein [Marinospirillum sp.]|uniref:TonB-dependent receptor domain-containing protein n=1 Tax=Marinospirillum sp. TaxID=2183934 RepID=UPI0028705465|nr:TonB-dependent receptor [Marinospirillum sp.]MDR9466871.1 TonB-dependent receptor [Marinospirillum sp.]